MLTHLGKGLTSHQSAKGAKKSKTREEIASENNGCVCGLLCVTETTLEFCR